MKFFAISLQHENLTSNKGYLTLVHMKKILGPSNVSNRVGGENKGCA